MVQNPRETSGPGPLRPLNLPAPIAVEVDAHQSPVAITLHGRRLKVASIDDLWEIDEEWWREQPIARRYYQVTTEDGRQLTIFWDLVGNGWYWQRA